jgi:hypothetical protein
MRKLYYFSPWPGEITKEESEILAENEWFWTVRDLGDGKIRSINKDSESSESEEEALRLSIKRRETEISESIIHIDLRTRTAMDAKELLKKIQSNKK